MKWPSEVLKDVADKLDGLEDAAYERYVAAETWAKTWKVWEWRRQQERIESLRNSNFLMAEEYEKLRVAYREKTGEEPPSSFVRVFADIEAYERSMDLLRDAMRKMGERMRAALGGHAD